MLGEEIRARHQLADGITVTVYEDGFVQIRGGWMVVGDEVHSIFTNGAALLEVLEAEVKR